MQARTRKVITGVLVASSALSLGGLLLFAWRRGTLLGRGELITKPSGRPHQIDQSRSGDMTVTHYRASNIPINQRVQLIQDRVYTSLTKDFGRVRELALKLTSGCKSRDNLCEAKAIYDAVRKRVRYTGDVAPILFPSGEVEPIDAFQSAMRTWEFGGGDCDDHAGLIASLLSSIGIPSRLRVTAPSKFSDWAHIYAMAGMPVISPKKWFALDTTLENPTRFGHEIRFGRNRDYVVKDLPA